MCSCLIFMWFAFHIIFNMKGLKIPKIIRRTDNTMTKRKQTKGQTMIYYTLYRKLKITHHEPHWQLGINSGSPEEWAVPASLGTPLGKRNNSIYYLSKQVTSSWCTRRIKYNAVQWLSVIKPMCYSIFSFICMFCRPLFVILFCLLLAIVLLVLLRFTDSDYTFGIFKLFLPTSFVFVFLQCRI
jgi:hypothetical protein